MRPSEAVRLLGAVSRASNNTALHAAVNACSLPCVRALYAAIGAQRGATSTAAMPEDSGAMAGVETDHTAEASASGSVERPMSSSTPAGHMSGLVNQPNTASEDTTPLHLAVIHGMGMILYYNYNLLYKYMKFYKIL